MIILCEDCGRKYRIDPENIEGEQARFRCKNCGNTMTVSKSALASEEPPELPELPELSDIPGFTEPSGIQNRENSAASSMQDEPPAFPEDEPSFELPPQPAAEEVTPPAQVQFESEPETTQPLESTPPTRTAKRGMGLATSMLLLVILVGILPLALTGGLVLTQAPAQIQAGVEQIHLEAATGLASQADQWVAQFNETLSSLASTKQITSMKRKQMQPVLQSFAQLNPHISLAFVLGPDGQGAARSDGRALKDHSDQPIYSQVMAGQHLAWQRTVDSSTGKPSLWLGVPIQSNKRTAGVLVCALRMESLITLFTDWQRGESGRAFLVDDQGLLLAHGDATLLDAGTNVSAHPLVTEIARTKGGAAKQYTHDGETLMGAAAATGVSWIAVVEQSTSEAMGAANRLLLFGGLVVGAAILFALLAAIVAGRRISRPLRELASAAERISVGDLDVEIDIRSGGEVGALADAIERMRLGIRTSIERMRRRR